MKTEGVPLCRVFLSVEGPGLSGLARGSCRIRALSSEKAGFAPTRSREKPQARKTRAWAKTQSRQLPQPGSRSIPSIAFRSRCYLCRYRPGWPAGFSQTTHTLLLDLQDEHGVRGSWRSVDKKSRTLSVILVGADEALTRGKKRKPFGRTFYFTRFLFSFYLYFFSLSLNSFSLLVFFLVFRVRFFWPEGAWVLLLLGRFPLLWV